MNITSSAGCLPRSAEDTGFPSTTLGSENPGILVPRGSIVEGTAAITTSVVVVSAPSAVSAANQSPLRRPGTAEVGAERGARTLAHQRPIDLVLRQAHGLHQVPRLPGL